MEAFDELADEYQRAHGENPHELAALETVAGRLAPGSRVLDLGCGSGVPTARFLTERGHHVVGVDLSGEMLERARRQVPGAEFRQGDMRELEFDDGSFQAVTAYFSLLMLSRAEVSAVLADVRRWLTPGGTVSIGMVHLDLDAVEVEFMGVPFRVTGYPLDAYPALFEGAGLRMLSAEAVDFTPLGQPSEPQIFALAESLPM